VEISVDARRGAALQESNAVTRSIRKSTILPYGRTRMAGERSMDIREIRGFWFMLLERESGTIRL